MSYGDIIATIALILAAAEFAERWIIRKGNGKHRK